MTLVQFYLTLFFDFLKLCHSLILEHSVGISLELDQNIDAFSWRLLLEESDQKGFIEFGMATERQFYAVGVISQTLMGTGIVYLSKRCGDVSMCLTRTCRTYKLGYQGT